MNKMNGGFVFERINVRVFFAAVCICETEHTCAESQLHCVVMLVLAAGGTSGADELIIMNKFG